MERKGVLSDASIKRNYPEYVPPNLKKHQDMHTDHNETHIFKGIRKPRRKKHHSDFARFPATDLHNFAMLADHKDLQNTYLRALYNYRKFEGGFADLPAVPENLGPGIYDHFGPAGPGGDDGDGGPPPPDTNVGDRRRPPEDRDDRNVRPRKILFQHRAGDKREVVGGFNDRNVAQHTRQDNLMRRVQDLPEELQRQIFGRVVYNHLRGNDEFYQHMAFGAA